MTKATEFLKEAGWTPEDADRWNHVHRPVDWYMNSLKIRDNFIQKFGFAILDDKTVESLQSFHPIVEVGAGSGYWSYELTQAGIECIATDPGTGLYQPVDGNWTTNPWVPIERITGLEAVQKYPNHTLLTVWPDLNHSSGQIKGIHYHDARDWPYETVAAYAGKTIIYVGEGDGGCTGTDAFHAFLEANFKEIDSLAIPQFWGIHDRLQIWQRNPHRTIRL